MSILSFLTLYGIINLIFITDWRYTVLWYVLGAIFLWLLSGFHSVGWFILLVVGLIPLRVTLEIKNTVLRCTLSALALIVAMVVFCIAAPHIVINVISTLMQPLY